MRGARNQQEIGKLIKQIREQQKLSQSELAKKAGLTQPTLSNIEHGISGNLKHLETLLRALNVEMLLQPITKIDISNLTKIAELID
jgi:transcriptional regulator with XRE-family HTH domain